MSPVHELVVIGAGPAGIEAALAAAEAGVPAVLVDHLPQAGGQYYKPLPPGFRGASPSRAETEAEQLFARLAQAPVTCLTGALTWGLFKDESGEGWQVALSGPQAPRELTSRRVILATGAYDTPVAFPGWTLPGVMTCGAALTLLKNQRVAPFRRVLLAGSGPLLLSAAAHLVEAGVEVVAVCEASRVFPQALRHGLAALGERDRLREGLQYLAILARGRVPYKLGWSILAARGGEQVSGAVITRIQPDGTPVPGTEETLAVDAVVCGYGLTPNTSLARMIDCRFDFQPETQTWLPWRDAHFQASQPGVYIVGDCAGIGGAANARLEGRLAGLDAAQRSGYLSTGQAEERVRLLAGPLANQRRFGALLARLFPHRPGLIALAQPDTILCRCEEISLGEIVAAVEAGARTIREVKMITRTGMGNCQGRNCESGVAAAIVRELAARGLPAERVGMYSIRPPLQPLPFGFFAEGVAQEDRQPLEM